MQFITYFFIMDLNSLAQLNFYIQNQKVQQSLPELVELVSILNENSENLNVEILNTIVIDPSHENGKNKNITLPLIKVILGSTQPSDPVLILCGGIHGLERIGTQVNLALMKSLIELSKWDNTTKEILNKIRIIFYPLQNPGGMLRKQRSNPNGIDLMRNAPLKAEDKTFFLLGGHQLSPKLPWYQGLNNGVMEVESQSLVTDVLQELKKSNVAISLDIHSGFGLQDQLWFPFAYSKKPFTFLAELYAWKNLLEITHPYHFYVLEPQSKNYVTHGDLWDYIFLEWKNNLKPDPLDLIAKPIYLPLCLELGSWLWIKKNPRQLFSSLGPFNPIVPHRKQRILRRHYTLFEFLIKSLLNPTLWGHITEQQKVINTQKANKLWFNH